MSPRKKRPVIVWYESCRGSYTAAAAQQLVESSNTHRCAVISIRYSAAVASASAPPVAATSATGWVASGHVVATVELCGFGTTGPVSLLVGKFESCQYIRLISARFLFFRIFVLSYKYASL